MEPQHSVCLYGVKLMVQFVLVSLDYRSIKTTWKVARTKT